MGGILGYIFGEKKQATSKNTSKSKNTATVAPETNGNLTDLEKDINILQGLLADLKKKKINASDANCTHLIISLSLNTKTWFHKSYGQDSVTLAAVDDFKNLDAEKIREIVTENFGKPVSSKTPSDYAREVVEKNDAAATKKAKAIAAAKHAKSTKQQALTLAQKSSPGTANQTSYQQASVVSDDDLTINSTASEKASLLIIPHAVLSQFLKEYEAERRHGVRYTLSFGFFSGSDAISELKAWAYSKRGVTENEIKTLTGRYEDTKKFPINDARHYSGTKKTLEKINEYFKKLRFLKQFSIDYSGNDEEIIQLITRIQRNPLNNQELDEIYLKLDAIYSNKTDGPVNFVKGVFKKPKIAIAINNASEGGCNSFIYIPCAPFENFFQSFLNHCQTLNSSPKEIKSIITAINTQAWRNPPEGKTAGEILMGICDIMLKAAKTDKTILGALAEDEKSLVYNVLFLKNFFGIYKENNSNQEHEKEVEAKTAFDTLNSVAIEKIYSELNSSNNKKTQGAWKATQEDFEPIPSSVATPHN